MINYNENAATQANSFNSDRILHMLTSSAFDIPVFPSSCAVGRELI